MMVVLHLLLLVTFDRYDETMTSLFCLFLEILCNLRFLFYCAATRLVPNVDYCHDSKMHSRGNAVRVLFPDYLELQTGSSLLPLLSS